MIWNVVEVASKLRRFERSDAGCCLPLITSLREVHKPEQIIDCSRGLTSLILSEPQPRHAIAISRAQKSSGAAATGVRCVRYLLRTHFFKLQERSRA
jgi:hypothetical protein